MLAQAKHQEAKNEKKLKNELIQSNTLASIFHFISIMKIVAIKNTCAFKIQIYEFSLRIKSNCRHSCSNSEQAFGCSVNGDSRCHFPFGNSGRAHEIEGLRVPRIFEM